jgi:hypothetical protein
MRLRLAERRAHHVTNVTGILPPDQCAHSAENAVYSHVRHSPTQEWIAHLWERSLGLSLLPHHSGYDRKEERDHQQPQEITDDHPPRRENAKIFGQSSYPHDAPLRKVVPCPNGQKGTSFPTKIMERRYQQPETLFDPMAGIFASSYIPID